MEEDGFIDISFTKIEVWKYFLKNKMLQKPKCERCKMILNCQRRSTSALKTHLNSKHNIKIENQSNLTQKSPRKRGHCEVDIEASTNNASASKNIKQ